MALLNLGYREPTGVYFREFDPLRFLRPSVFHSVSAGTGIAGSTAAMFDGNTSPQNITLAQNFYYWYRYNDFVNSADTTVSGFVQLAREQPLDWRYMDNTPTGQYVRILRKSVCFPYNDIGILPDGYSYRGAPTLLTENGNSPRLTQGDAIKLSWHQTDDLIGQIQLAFKDMFDNPRINSKHPSYTVPVSQFIEENRNQMHPIGGTNNVIFGEIYGQHERTSGIPVPEIPSNISLQLNNLALKPTGWLLNDSSPNLIPGSGRYPILDVAQQINTPYEYANNINCVGRIPGPGLTYIGSTGINDHKVHLTPSNMDLYRSLIHFNTIHPTSVSIQWNLSPIVSGTINGIVTDRFGNTKNLLYRYQSNYYYQLINDFVQYLTGPTFGVNRGNPSGSHFMPATGMVIERFLRYYDNIADSSAAPFNNIGMGGQFTNYLASFQTAYWQCQQAWDLIYLSGDIGHGDILDLTIPTGTFVDEQTDSTLLINDISIPFTAYDIQLYDANGNTPQHTGFLGQVFEKIPVPQKFNWTCTSLGYMDGDATTVPGNQGHPTELINTMVGSIGYFFKPGVGASNTSGLITPYIDATIYNGLDEVIGYIPAKFTASQFGGPLPPAAPGMYTGYFEQANIFWDSFGGFASPTDTTNVRKNFKNWQDIYIVYSGFPQQAAPLGTGSIDGTAYSIVGTGFLFFGPRSGVYNALPVLSTGIFRFPINLTGNINDGSHIYTPPAGDMKIIWYNGPDLGHTIWWM
jgi:hypothetical protein